MSPWWYLCEILWAHGDTISCGVLLKGVEILWAHAHKFIAKEQIFLHVCFCVGYEASFSHIADVKHCLWLTAWFDLLCMETFSQTVQQVGLFWFTWGTSARLFNRLGCSGLHGHLQPDCSTGWVVLVYMETFSQTVQRVGLFWFTWKPSARLINGLGCSGLHGNLQPDCSTGWVVLVYMETFSQTVQLLTFCLICLCCRILRRMEGCRRPPTSACLSGVL